MGKRRKKPGHDDNNSSTSKSDNDSSDSTTEKKDDTDSGETKEEKPLVNVSSKPDITPTEVVLSESEKNINPPDMGAFPQEDAFKSWGPANKRRR